MKAFVFYRDAHFPERPVFGSNLECERPDLYQLKHVEVGCEQRFKGRKHCLEFMFWFLNDSDIRPQIRSMSVGDIIIFEDYDLWVCKPIGWERREDVREWARQKVFEALHVCEVCKLRMKDKDDMSPEHGLCAKCWDHKTD